MHFPDAGLVLFPKDLQDLQLTFGGFYRLRGHIKWKFIPQFTTCFVNVELKWGRHKKSPDVETTGLRYLDLISVLDWMIKIYLQSNS
jgi:hypothetical protein